MGQIEDLRLFLTVVDNQSITKAADHLNIAKSAVSRRLSLLEQRYDSRLVERGPGVWRVTQAGEELYQRAQRAVGEIDDIEADFVSASADLSGPLSVSVPREFGLGFLKPALLDFKLKYPQIILSVDFDDRTLDLAHENYDFAIRITPRNLDGAEVTEIGEVEHALYASPDYLDSRTPPATLADLKDHRLLHFGTARRTAWTFLTDRGKEQEFEFHPFLNSNSGVFLLDATKKGLGISRLPDFIAGRAHEQGEIVKILAEVEIPKSGIYLVRSPGRRLNRRMRVFAEEVKIACATIL